MAWLSTGSSKLTEGWDSFLQPKIKFEDRTDAEWINLNTGASLVMVADGGWRGAQYGTYRSHYRVFLRGSQAAPVEMTFAFLGHARNGGVFDKGQTGSDNYSEVRNSCVAEIERILKEH